MDQIDRQIIDILRQNGRITMIDLGRQIAMSSTSTTERVKRLEEDGVILGYQAVVDDYKLGNQIHAFLLVESSSEMRRSPERFEKLIQTIPEVRAAYYAITGGIDNIIEVFCANLDRLSQIQQQIYITFNVNTTTYMVRQNSFSQQPE